MASTEQEYPQLRAALTDYIIPGKEDELVFKYQRDGEESAEFNGLGAELQTAAKDPDSVVPLFYDLVGFEGEPRELREGCIDLYNRLKNVGDYDPEKIEGVEGAELFAKSGGMPLHLGDKPVTIRGKVVPLWGAAAFFMGVVAVGYLLMFVPWPGFLRWLPAVFFMVGLAGLLFTSAAVVMLRSEAKDPAKAARRAKALEAVKERNEQRAARREGWFRKNMTF